MIDTPCKNLCAIDPATQRCRGCLRTIDEIASWSALSPAQRENIMAALPLRAGASDPASS